ncbi:MAG: hypothetical protein LBU57_08965 [Dysgonamonadaceae bacterium]|jgi:hypothetical protein|nr:hypothetical protein [Dysgonamonadaceae bacterium]
MDTLMNELSYKVDMLISEQRASKNRSRVKNEKTKNTEDIQKVLSICDQIINLDCKDKLSEKYARFIRAVCYSEKEKWYDAFKDLKDLGYEDYWIYKQKRKYTGLYDEMISCNLKDCDIEENSDIFHTYLSNCHKIYDCIFKIMDFLIVEDENLRISHYTTKKTVEKLLFDNSPLRMCSMATANDPSEGRVIYEFLEHPEWYDAVIGKNKLQCFVTCFTFDSNCLNHFRLYGKENEKEATGVSLGFEAEAFDCLISDQLKFEEKTLFFEKYKKAHLFRCLYIYPVTKDIISIGHTEYEEIKEDWEVLTKDKMCTMFEKEKKIVSEENMKEIRTKMNEMQKNINNFINIEENKINIEENKIIIDENKAKRIEIVSKMLLNLSYIVKHAAFKEEQESRLFYIVKLNSTKSYIKFCDNSRKMYVEYDLPMEKLKKITFAPKTTEYLLLKDRLELFDGFETVECVQSKLPIA